MSTWSMMYLKSAAQGLYIEYLMFDGNRWAFGVTSLGRIFNPV